METEQFLEAHLASNFRLIGYITPLCGGFTIRVEVVATGAFSGEALDFIAPGPFATEEDAKIDTSEFAKTSGYELTWIGPATWQ